MAEENTTDSQDDKSGQDVDLESVGGLPTPIDEDDTAAILNFDPFAEQEQEDGANGSASDANAADDNAGTAEAAAAAPSGDEGNQDQSTQTSSTQTSNDETLAAQNAALLARVAALEQAATAPPADTQQGNDAATPNEPDFAFTIPNELQALLDSTEPAERQRGLAVFAQGVAKTAYTQAMDQLNAAVAQQIPALIESRIAERQSQQRIQTDFFTTHKDLNNRAFAPVISQVAKQVAVEQGATGWNDKLRDETAKRVRQLLGMKQPNGQSTTTTTQTNNRPPARVPDKSAGSRTNRRRKTAQEDLEDFVFGELQANQR